MYEMPGPISDHLRSLFGPGDPAWTPTREPAAAVDVPEDDYFGLALGRATLEQEEEQP
jgi:hypothetical protein